MAAAAAWIVYPKGSEVNLKKLKINYQQTFKVHLGLDLQGGSHLVYQADFKDVPASDRADAQLHASDLFVKGVYFQFYGIFKSYRGAGFFIQGDPGRTPGRVAEKWS